MRSLAIAAFLATLSLAPAYADISWKTQEIAPGSTVTLKNDLGQTFTHLRRASKGAVVRFDTFAGGAANGAYLGSYLTDANGEILRTIAADGSETDYEPSKCNRSLGKCSYIIKTPDGKKVLRTRITEATRDGLKYAEYEGRALVESGMTALDHKGTSAGGWHLDHASGQRVATRQVSAVYK